MMKSLNFDLEEIFEEIVTAGKAQAAFTEAAYHQLVEDIIEDHRRIQEIHDDQNTEGYATQLKERWPEYKTRVTAK